MSNYMRRLPLLRRPAQVADPGEMVDLRMEEGSWRQGFFRARAKDGLQVIERSPVQHTRAYWAQIYFLGGILAVEEQ